MIKSSRTIVTECAPSTGTLEEGERIHSPGGRYELWVESYGEGARERALFISALGSGDIVFEHQQLAGNARICWHEAHSSGHDYIFIDVVISRFEFHQIIVELDTGRFVEGSASSFAFSLGRFVTDRRRNRLFAAGSNLLGSAEFVVFDISDPLALPYPRLASWDALLRVDAFVGFRADFALIIEATTDRRTTDHKLVLNLPGEERASYEDTDSDRTTIEVSCRVGILDDLSLELTEHHACYPPTAYLCDYGDRA